MRAAHLLIWILLAVLASAQAQAGGSSQLKWSTVDCGGGTSEGGTFKLSGTIGQPDAGAIAGGSFRLEGGFWSGAIAIQTPGAPLLKIRMAGDNAIVSWPASATGFTLEESTSLAGGWTITPQPASIDGTEHAVTVPVDGPVKFFRLRQ